MQEDLGQSVRNQRLTAKDINKKDVQKLKNSNIETNIQNLGTLEHPDNQKSARL